MMDLTWYVLGFLSGASAYWLYVASQKYQLGAIEWTGLVLGIFLILFCIAWVVGTVLEGVPRAASMGIILFAFPGIVILTLTYRLMSSRNRETLNHSEKA